MAENVGTIYYEVEADTEKLLNSVSPTDKSLDKLNRTLGKTDRAAGKADAKLKKTSEAVKGLGNQSKQTTSIMSRFLPLLAGIATLNTAKQIVAMSDAWQGYLNRLRLVTSSQEELEKSMQDIFDIAQRTSQDLDPVVQVYQRFAQNADALGLSLDDVAKVTETVSKAVSISGASSEAASAALTQFGQGLASGVLRGEELNSVMEQTPALAQAIADGLGITIGELRAVAAEGKITSEALIEALSNASESVDEKFSTRVKTVGQAWSEFTNAITKFVGESAQSTGIMDQLANGISGVAKAISEADTEGFGNGLKDVRSALDVVAEGTKGAFDELSNFLGLATDGSAEAADYMEKNFNESQKEIAKDIAELYGIFEKPIDGIKAMWTEFTKSTNQSFRQTVLELARDIDRLVEMFTGASGSVNNMWEAVTNNIPNFFKNAWNSTLKSASGFVNDLAGLINKPLNALGFEGITKAADWGGGKDHPIVSISEAAKKGWDEAAKSAGFYDKLIARIGKRVGTQVLGDIAARDYEEHVASNTPKNKETEDNTELTEKNTQTKTRNAAATRQQAVETDNLTLAMDRLREKIGDDPLSYIKGDVSPLSGGAFDNQTARYDAEAEAEIERYAAQLERLRESFEAKAVLQSEYNTIFEDLQKTHVDRMNQIDQARMSTMLSAASDGFGALADILRQSQGEQSSAYKAMFAVSKAFSIAQATLGLYTAISEAWKLPWPANIPAIATATASMGQIVSGVSSVAMGGGRQYGGPVAPNSMHRINENGKPEILNMANGRQYLLPNGRGEVVSNKDATSGSSVINLPAIRSGGVQVNITIKDGKTQMGSNTSGLEQFGKQIGEFVESKFKELEARSYRQGGTAWQHKQGAF